LLLGLGLVAVATWIVEPVILLGWVLENMHGF
jgi:hypothetical protein